MTSRNKLSARQHAVLREVVRTTLNGEWYRATSEGERVTLASLHRRGLLERRAWRGEAGDCNTAYEYRPVMPA